MSAVVKAPQEMNIYSVAQVRGEVLEMLNQHTEVEFDVSGLADIDGAGVQLLVSISRPGTKGIRVVGMSEALRERFAGMGLERIFEGSRAIGATQ